MPTGCIRVELALAGGTGSNHGHALGVWRGGNPWGSPDPDKTAYQVGGGSGASCMGKVLDLDEVAYWVWWEEIALWGKGYSPC